MPPGDLIFGICGVFLLKEDTGVKACYNCLSSSPLGQCAGPNGGGLGCTAPFLLLSFVFQCAATTFAWRLHSLVSSDLMTSSIDDGFGDSFGGDPSQPREQQMRMLP